MTAQHLLSTVRPLLAPAVIVGFLVCRGWSAEPKQKANPADTTAISLVRAALESEEKGDNQRRNALLRQALYDSPNNALAHWHLGELRVSGVWQSPAEVERVAQQNKRLTEYCRLRDAARPEAADQAALARWCRQNRLEDQQRVHWQTVLQLQPGDAEAIQALGLRPYQGMMLTLAQIEQFRTQQQRVLKATKQWRPLVAQWRGAVEGHDSAIPLTVREQIAKISDAAEMVALEAELWRHVAVRRQARLYHDMTLAMMPALGDNPRPAAAESLARYAAFSGFKDVRAAAIAGLKRHPLDHYVPLLLSGLQSPIEASMQWTLGANGDLLASYSVFQEGALANVSSTLMLAPAYSAAELAPVTPASVTPGTGTVQFDSPQEKRLLMRTDPGYVAAAYAQARADAAAIPRAADVNAANAVAAAENWQLNSQNARAQAIRNAAAMSDAVDRANSAIADRNAQIMTALRRTTGLDLGDQPIKWWTWWWQDYNEMYNVSGDSNQPPKPEYHNDNYVEYRGSTPTYQPTTTVGSGPVACSCFAPDTKVWTLTGRRPIDRIRIGDLVLAQDVESGELAYKPVLAVTTRQPGRWMKIGLGTESIIATPSHPFWAVGQGWQMTKQLKAGNRVHSLAGGVLVEDIETLDTDPSHVTAAQANLTVAYNLIVADYHSYLVGDRGMLSHDNTPRKPTSALLPGFADGPSPTTSYNREDEARLPAE